jgi:thiol:disulfide interchange protein/DsbC/DsbD-like thiol-disulfide interchange protein
MRLPGFVTLAILSMFLVRPAGAAESAPVVSPRVTATLVSDTDAVAPGKPYRVGLLLRMAPGWHTYWKNPGDAGAAPELSFSPAAGPVEWPAPERQREGPLITYGYSGAVLLAAAMAAPGPVQLHATWLVCAQICVPEQGDFRLDLPAGTPAAGSPAPSAQAPLFAAAAARLPRPSPWAARIAPDGVLSLAGNGLDAVRDAWFVPAAFGTVNGTAAQKFSQRPGGIALALTPGTDFKPGAGLAGVLVLRDRDGMESALDIDAAPGPEEAVVPLVRVLGLAFLGGLILNLMPCVFPVLAMKAVGLARLSGKERGHAVGHAAAYTAGVLVCFTLVAFMLLAVRRAGAAAGWGFQFQSPAFVAFMAWVLFAVGLNLSGVFAFAGPAAAGQRLAARGGHLGSFATGLLAVLVATPCTAPFMSVAIAVGLAGAPPVTLAVFASMGLGLAAPYALLASVPAVTRALPRPGRWMVLLKQALAFPMYAACAWLAWVESQVAGPSGVLAIAAGLVLLGFAAWVLGLARSRTGRRITRAAAAGAVIAAAGVLSALAANPAAPAAATDVAGTEPFSDARLAALRAEGKPVFVNITAAWCVTCLVNERVALESDSVRRAFAGHGVTYLKGDWTRQDPAITRFLREHGRDGVPLYLLFPAEAGAPLTLPQILTPGIVTAALGQIDE